MRTHRITLAALLVVLAPLTAAAQGVAQARVVHVTASDARQTEEALTSVADEAQGMEPVYTPGNVAGQYYPGPYGPAADGGSCGCGCQSCQPQPCCESCCECCPCCCGPCWEVQAAGVVLRRSNPDNVTFLTNAVTGAELFNLSQFSFDYEPGVDASVICHLNPCVSVEARYLGLFDVNDQVFAGPFPATAAVLNTSPLTPITLAAGATIDAEYRSELHSGEINLRARAAPWLNLMGGFRYLNLREEFHADILVTPLIGQVVQPDTQVRNQLYGMQIGAEGNLFVGGGGRYNVGGFAKGGIYAVEADHDATLSQTLPTLVFRGSASDTQAAFVGEAGVNASFQITRCLSVTAGYQIIWLEGVAVASDQVPVTGVPSIATGLLAPTHVDVDGHVFYHGAKLGVELRF